MSAVARKAKNARTKVPNASARIIQVPPPSWDYNCDGVSNRAPEGLDCSSLSSSDCSGSFTYNYQDACFNKGCGEDAIRIECLSFGGSCSPTIYFEPQAIVCQ